MTGPIIVKLEILAVKAGRDVSGLFAPFQLPLIGLHDLIFDLVAAIGVDRVRNVGMELQPVLITLSVAELQIAFFVQSLAAMVAEAGTQVILLPAGGAVVGQFARRHRKEEPVIPVDQLHVADDERVIKGK
ncbi:MAG TPA: hypothetical protein VGI81_28955 [Tepidisphaeraceae bacterium]